MTLPTFNLMSAGLTGSSSVPYTIQRRTSAYCYTSDLDRGRSGWQWQDDRRGVARWTAPLAVRRRRHVPPGSERHEDARGHPADRRRPRTVAAGDHRLDG